MKHLEQQMVNFESIIERPMKKLKDTSTKVDSLVDKNLGEAKGSRSRNRRGKNYGVYNLAVPKLAK